MDGGARERRAGAFGSGAEAYERGRPSYPLEAVEACLPGRAACVLDLAAGTGKLTGLLLELGLDVLAVEPLAAMRALLPPEAEAIAGTAEALPLPDGCVDAVLVGQAFHWFDRDRALREIVRVLRPHGTVGLLWNLIDDTVPWASAVADAFDAEDRASLLSGEAPFTSVAGLADPQHLVIPHAQSLSPSGLVDNIASRSTVILLPPSERAALLARIRSLAPSERFDLPYVCSVWRSVRR